jgi:hypothetical protein
MRFWLTLCLLLMIFSSVTVPALSYQSTIRIRGTLLDANDAVIPGALVTVRATDRKTRAYSDERGSFEIDLPAGVHEVEIDAAGFKKLVVTNLEGITGMTEELKLRLEPQPPAICPIVAEVENIEIVHSPLTERIKPQKFQ